MTGVDLVKRLREFPYNEPLAICIEAADEIERLKTECTQLKAQQKELLTNRKLYEG